MARDNDGDTRTFIGGLLLGLLLSAPIAAWFSPYSGHSLRQEIRQRGQIVVRRAGQTAQKVGQIPAKIGEGVGQIGGQITGQVGQIQEKVLGRDSIDEALEEGRMIAAQRRGTTPM
jgi:gas vesicle protein